MNATARSFVFACVDCGVSILDAGGGYAPGVREITYGQCCEVHGEGRPDSPATYAVVVPIGWTRPRGKRDELVAPEEAETPTGQPGILTRITADLVVAWSRDHQHADETLVGAAAHVARMILTSTKGE